MPTIDEELRDLLAQAAQADTSGQIRRFFEAVLELEGGESAELPVLIAQHTPAFARDTAREGVPAAATAAELGWDLLDSINGAENSSRVRKYAGEYINSAYGVDKIGSAEKARMRRYVEGLNLPVSPETMRRIMRDIAD